MFIIQYWHTKTVPPDVQSLVETFREKNPEYSHLLFDRAVAEDFIAANFSEREIAAFRACAVPAMQADYLRYCAVLALGGVYADADMRCFQGLGPLTEAVGSAEFFWKPALDRIMNAFFIVRSPGHPFLRCALELATLNIERRAFENVWVATGPALFSTLYWLSKHGSVEACRQRLSDKEPVERVPLEILLDIAVSVVGGRLGDILTGVQFSPISKLRPYARSESVAYKKSDTHWLNWRTSIFR